MASKKNQTKYQTIMLVDDNEIDNFINQKMIEGSGFAEDVFIYTSGKSALEFLKNIEKSNQIKNESLIPDYIFLDINMPMMDGFQFLEEFENLDKKIVDKAKIVMLTTSINPQDRVKSNQLDRVEAFYNKPLTDEYLEEL